MGDVARVDVRTPVRRLPAAWRSLEPLLRATNIAPMPKVLATPSGSAISVIRLSASQTIPLRHAVLWPDRPPAFVVLPEDELPSTIHLGAILASPSQPHIQPPREPVSVVTLAPTPFPSSAEDLSSLPALRFRKFATASAHQGRGYGAQLLSAAFALADSIESGVELVWCDARFEQESWYERRGMRRDGDTFEKEGRMYVRMVRPRPS